MDTARSLFDNVTRNKKPFLFRSLRAWVVNIYVNIYKEMNSPAQVLELKAKGACC
jgi:hypothetical protein